MKKTINVNIGGMMFHLDEDAFEKCKIYLDTLKQKFGKVEGGNEIIDDIESRIAEIFKEKLSNIREVVSLQDVEDMVSIMGDPNLFIEEESEVTSDGLEENHPIVKRRLFRDPEKRVLGGVCSGFGAYFNIDPWVVRIIMIGLVLFAGVSFLLYFVFWLAMPKAITTSDRLLMKGRRVDVNSIEESVKKEWSETKSGIKNAGKNARSSSVFKGIGKFFRIGFGVSFIFFSTLILAGFIWTMCTNTATMHFDYLHISVKEGAGLIFDSFAEKFIAYISVWLLIVVPSVLFIYLGIRLILQFKHKLRYVMLGGFMLWMIGLVLAIYSGITIAEKYKMEASTKETPPIMIADSAVIMVSTITSDEIKGYNLGGLAISNVDFDIIKNSTDSVPTLEIMKHSQGRDKQSAFDLSERITYSYQLDSNKLQLAPYFMLDQNEKFRGQRVSIKLMLPVGFKVFLAKGTEKVIHDISNIQDVWDHHMPEHIWTMTVDGLSCDDCKAEIMHLDHQHQEDFKDNSELIDEDSIQEVKED